MRKKTFFKKLALAKQTIAHLSDEQMRVAQAGADTNTDFCDTFLDCTETDPFSIAICPNAAPINVTHNCV